MMDTDNGSVNRETSYYDAPEVMQSQANAMATTAVVMGIMSIVFTFIIPVYLPCIFGSVSIVMALLSRGSGTMVFRARMGMVISIIVMIANIAILITGVYMILTVPEMQEEFNRLLETMEGYR